MGGVESVAERGEVADAPEGRRGAADADEATFGREGAGAGVDRVVVAVGVDLRGLGGRWGRVEESLACQRFEAEGGGEAEEADESLACQRFELDVELGGAGVQATTRRAIGLAKRVISGRSSAPAMLS